MAADHQLEPIDPQHLRHVCQPGRGPLTCAYLAAGGGGFFCAKGTSIEAELTRRRAAREMRAAGDNCAGPPGYEIPDETAN